MRENRTNDVKPAPEAARAAVAPPSPPMARRGLGEIEVDPATCPISPWWLLPFGAVLGVLVLLVFSLPLVYGVIGSMMAMVVLTIVHVWDRRRLQRAMQIAQELEAQRVELQSIIDAIPAFVYYKDGLNTILDLNRTAAESIGLPREDIQGRATEDFFPLEDAMGFHEDDVEVLRTGQPKLGIVEEYETANVGRRLIRTDKIPLRGPTGTFDRLVGIATDITELHETTRQLEELRARFERATEGATDGLWDYEPATGAVWYSDQFKKLIGLEPEAYDTFRPTLESFEHIIHPLDYEPTFAAIAAHLERDEPYDVTYRLRMAKGGYRWFRARGQATRNERGEAVRMSGSLTDIDDQHTAETRLDLATRAARIGLWDWDVPTGLTHFSDTFYTMLGYEPGELPMCLETWSDLAHPEDLGEALADIQRHLTGETDVYVNEHRLRRKDGTWLWVRDIGEIVERNEDGTPRRMTGVHVDIQALREAKDAAEAANLAKSDFLANMSHEIRTPMTAILGFVDLLDTDPDVARNPADAIRTIRSNADHLLTIINDILDVSKIEAGRLHVERVGTSPASIVEQVVALVRPRAAEKGIDLVVRYETPIPERIRTDPTRLHQILLNLTGNAVKFTEQGSVTVHVECDAAAQRMRFRIADTGIGMTPTQCAAVARFEAFSQADTSTTRLFGGTGLGLRITNGLAMLLDGRLDVDSAAGVGSTFTATIGTGDLDGVTMFEPERLASMVETRSSAPPRSAPAYRPLAGARILVAEDGPDNQRLISFHLEKAGAAVTVVENGLVAVKSIEQAAAEAHPDLVLMDMQMPVLDGYGATRRLRAGGIRIPVIALTAHAMNGDRERCLQAGCDDYVTKPIDRATLIAACRTAIDGNGSRDAA